MFPDLHLKTAKDSLWKVREPLPQHFHPDHVYRELPGCLLGPFAEPAHPWLGSDKQGTAELLLDTVRILGSVGFFSKEISCFYTLRFLLS